MRFSQVLVVLPLTVNAARILQSNDDGWAEANIRTFNKVLNDANNDVVLSAPADNQSGRSSLDLDPLPRLRPCQYNSCPALSPAVGSDPANPRLNYVNSFPATSARIGLSQIGPKFWNGGRPDIVVTGPNVGSNLDIQVPFSGTVGAAVLAVNQFNVPAIAFSGRSGEPTSYATTPTPASSQVYADLAWNLTSTLLETGAPYLPANTFLNVNFPATSSDKCGRASDFRFVLSRINPRVPPFSTPDIAICGRADLPRERDVVDTASGCYVSVSVGNSRDKTTAGRDEQQLVYAKLQRLLSCLP